MVSSKDVKENVGKKSQMLPPSQSPLPDSNNNTRKLPSTENQTKMAFSPKQKLKKKPSNDRLQNSEQRSADITEATVNDEEINAILAQDPSVSNMQELPVANTPEAKPIEAAVKPPPTHFLAVPVKLPVASFNSFIFVYLNFNKNMVVTGVKKPWMHLFMPGDQIVSVNQSPVWTRTHIDREIIKYNQKKTEITMTVTVIRPWNLKCLSQYNVEKLFPPPDERVHFFNVRVYCSSFKQSGLMIRAEKKRMIVVQHIRAKSPISWALLVGDQIIGINEELLVGKSKKLIYSQLKSQLDKSRKTGYADIMACRPISARSSAAPSVDAELADLFPDTAVGVEKGTKLEKKKSELLSNVPLEGDALEIALRELTCLQQFVKEDLPLPDCDKGRSLLRINSSGSGLTKTSSTTCIAEKSLYSPIATNTTSTMTTATPTAGTPRKYRGIFKKGNKNNQSISFMEQPETARITSDVAEEAELKKCDPRSGIVAYIKNAFNN